MLLPTFERIEGEQGRDPRLMESRQQNAQPGQRGHPSRQKVGNQDPKFADPGLGQAEQAPRGQNWQHSNRYLGVTERQSGGRQPEQNDFPGRSDLGQHPQAAEKERHKHKGHGDPDMLVHHRPNNDGWHGHVEKPGQRRLKN